MRQGAVSRWAVAVPLLLFSCGLLAAGICAPAEAAASKWPVSLAAGSRGSAASLPAPSAPTTVSAVCATSGKKKITVSWSAVTSAGGYTVLESTSSATGPFSAAATTTTATTWTSDNLSKGSYWFEVQASVGTHWTGAASAATAPRTLSGSTCS